MKKIAILLPLFAISLSGCSNIKYSGKFYDDLGERINDAFANENQVNLKLSSSNSDLPRTINYVVDSVGKYDAAFKSDYKIDINYEKELLILCSFLSIYKKEHYLNKLDLNDGVLTIECDYKKGAPGTGYACAPYQRWCAIKMDIVEYNSIDFVGEGR